MKINNWDLIAKSLASETSVEEESLISELRQNDSNFDAAFSDSEKIWNGIQKPKTEFNKERIVFIRDQKIRLAKKQKNIRFINNAVKYAAVFIGFLAIIMFTYNDITNQIVISANDGKSVDLPDGSQITLNNNSSISYNNSLILGFGREVTILEGVAYFEIEKQNGQNFIVKTNNYDIEVLGTKFIVNNSELNTTVTLDEGKVELSNYSAIGIKNISMLPGDEVVFGNSMTKPIKSIVNSNVSKYWMKSKLEFDNYSLKDLKLIFRKYYNKELILDESEIGFKNVSGSAPTDDVDLIVKALSKIFNRELIVKKDSIVLQ